MQNMHFNEKLPKVKLWLTFFFRGHINFLFMRTSTKQQEFSYRIINEVFKQKLIMKKVPSVKKKKKKNRAQTANPLGKLIAV